ncbi:pyruvate synthase subunit beta [Candidatus Pacearchaeota archaeon]|nr:pyruvate synthase subunit beta [Candidatus Pacearchaeota archaeon]
MKRIKKLGQAKKETKKIREEKLEEFEGFVSGHNACAGCGAAIAMRHIARVAGRNSIISIATGCMEVVSTSYPLTAWKLPLIHSAFENAAATASGIDAALRHLNKKTNVIAIAGDGGTFDIGFQALSGAIERNQNFLFICYDNEAYMNTGIQRSGSTPRFTETTTSPYGRVLHGKLEWKKQMPFIVAAHGCYSATASIAFLSDFHAKIKKALAIPGPKFISVLAPCTIGWKIQNSDAIEISRLAVQTGIFPLYEVENGTVKLNFDIKSRPVSEYLKRQGRFEHLNDREIREVQKKVDEIYGRIKNLSNLQIKIF